MVRAERGLQPEGRHPSRGVAASGFRPLRNIPHCCLPQESGPCLSPSVAGRPLRPATRHRLGRPSPHQQADRPRAHPRPETLSTAAACAARSYPVLAPVSRSYPRAWGRLPTCYSPVRHSPTPESMDPFDLHVLSTPPAFVLSQDQTLQKRIIPADRPDGGRNINHKQNMAS